MFNKENKNTTPADDNLKSIKIHTMKDDLAKERSGDVIAEKEKEPEYKPEINGGSPFLSGLPAEAREAQQISVENKGSSAPLENNATIETIFPAEPFDNVEQNNSPRYSNPNSNQLNGISAYNQASPIDVKNDNIYSDSSEFINSEEKSSGSIFMYIVLVILILLLGMGGYYFWMVKEGKAGSFTLIQDTFESIINKEDKEKTPPINEPILIKDSAKVEFSDNANFLIIGDGELSQTGIGAAIENKFSAMEDYSGNQLEFLLVDKNNKPIAFKDFADNFKITLDAEILSNLELNNFSIFLYKKDNLKRVALVLSVKNKEALLASLLKNEATLVSSLNSLFMYDKPDNTNVIFSDSTYGNNAIRYANLNKKLDLSLDYTINGDYLILATSKDSARLIMDKLSEELEKNENVFAPEE